MRSRKKNSDSTLVRFNPAAAYSLRRLPAATFQETNRERTEAPVNLRLLTTEDAAKLLAVSRSTIATRMNNGTIPWLMFGHRRRIPLAGIERLIERGIEAAMKQSAPEAAAARPGGQWRVVLLRGGQEGRRRLPGHAMPDQRKARRWNETNPAPQILALPPLIRCNPCVQRKTPGRPAARHVATLPAEKRPVSAGPGVG
jgi:excisionase family DNA binding protein